VTNALQNRPGVALAAAIVVLLLIECIVAGMVHIVMIERRSSANAELALRARLAAASAAAAAAAAWTPAMDTLVAPGSAVLLDSVEPVAGLDVRTGVERLADGLFLVRTVASRTSPPVARAADAILVVPPAFHIGADPAAAALSAASVVLESGGVIDAGNRECAPGDAAAVRLTSRDEPYVGPGAVVVGGTMLVDSAASLVRDMARVRVAAAAAAGDGVIHTSSELLRLAAPFDGVIVTAGDLILEPGAHVRGLVLVGGRLFLEAGALIEGAAHVRFAAQVAGEIRFDGCLARNAAFDAALHRPRPFTPRSRVPAF
jgi:hypothetical protein